MAGKVLSAFLLSSLVLAACSPVVVPTSLTPTPPLPTQLPIDTTPTGISTCTFMTGPTATPNATEAATGSLFAPVSGADWTTGPENAPVTLIEYSDFQCPSCAVFNAVLHQVLLDFPQDVRVVFRPFPQSTNDKALLSAQAVEAAGAQGKFWEMADLLFNGQADWSSLSSADFETWVDQQAAGLNLDAGRFTADRTSTAIASKLAAELSEESTIGIPGVPFVLINGKIWQGPTDITSIETVINLLLLANKQITGCPPTVIDLNKQYLAHLVTDKGEIVIQLFPDVAPIAVNSFVFLAEKGWFNGVTFHRVIPGAYAQTGDPSGTGYGTPGYAFKNEISPDLKFDKAGVVGMASAGSGSNGSQFFITLAAQPDLDGQATIFGQVIQGMDVVNSLTPRDPTQSGVLAPGDKILEVTIEEK